MTEKSEPLTALGAIPAEWATPPPETIAVLPKPTRKDNQKGQCKVCGGWHGLPAVHLSYMGHAEVTLALISIDPGYTYGWVTDERGSMLVKERSGHLVLEGWLTVHGKTLPGVGTCSAGDGGGEPEKVLIGDLLRNCAMRFGIGTSLWSKADGLSAQVEEPAAEPDPVETLIMDVMGRLTELKDRHPDDAETVREWAHGQDRKLSAPALRADAAWLDQVRVMLDQLEQDRTGQVEEPF